MRNKPAEAAGHPAPGIRTAIRLALLVVLSVLAVGFPTRSADAAPANGLSVTATVDGQSITTADATKPLKLGDKDQARIVATFTNSGTNDLAIRSVRLEGRVMGLAFFSYTTRLDIVLPPSQTTERRFDIDVEDLSGQANGLIPTSFEVLGPKRQQLGHQSLVVNVQGSPASIYSLFGLIIAGITAMLIVMLLVSVIRRSLPTNRWQRGLRLLPVGLGIGFVLTFSLSASRLLAPSTSLWLPAVIACGAGAFLLGYVFPALSPDQTSPSTPSPTHTGESSPTPRLGAHTR